MQNNFIEKIHGIALLAVHATLQQGSVAVDTERCKGCGLCVAECPAHTLSLSQMVNPRGYVYSQQTSPERCIGCASCALICPDACIEVSRSGVVPHEPLQIDNYLENHNN